VKTTLRENYSDSSGIILHDTHDAITTNHTRNNRCFLCHWGWYCFRKVRVSITHADISMQTPPERGDWTIKLCTSG